jgi:steroid delta-isomerase-like uncharacterized protein
MAGLEETTEPAAPSVDWIHDLVRRWLDAWNSHLPDEVLALLTEDVEIRDDSWPTAMHGHTEVREFLEALWRAMPDMTFELITGPYVMPAQPCASFRWRGAGTFTGPMNPPGFAPTGRRWEVDGADFHEYRDGRIARLRVVLDVMSVSRQVGLMPPTGSRGERAMAVVQRGVVRLQRRYRRRDR